MYILLFAWIFPTDGTQHMKPAVTRFGILKFEAKFLGGFTNSKVEAQVPVQKFTGRPEPTSPLQDGTQVVHIT
jgi:hypothetical protein